MAGIPSISRSNRNNAFVLRRPVLISLAFLAAVFILRMFDLFILRLDGLPDEMIVSRVLGFLLVLGFLQALRKPLSSIGLHAKNINQALLVGGLSLVVLYVVLYAVQFFLLASAGESPRIVFGKMDLASGMTGGLSFTLFFLLGQIVNALMEESIFRGIMLPHFMRLFRFWQANILQAFLFGLAHLVFPLHSWLSGRIPLNAALAEAGVLLLMTTVGGLVFGYLYYRTSSLWVPILAHTIDNIVLQAFHLQTASRFNAETDISMLASLGYLLLPLLAWVVAKRSNLPTLKAWGPS